ncbi:NBS-LRR type resistance protein [Cucumis melo var. makuwa]|uniref:NBS-LRR type resistance protein n=1 Tax=Cucumis melo var. makuwa TaxID=1194695 RepID=A0A5D3CIX8_CUCMM|nr:NBS-LRR type resistance protein [Cucumis melo var. makuwa]
MTRPGNENTSNKIHQRKHKENQTRPYGLHASFLPLVGLPLAVPLPEKLKKKKGEYKTYPSSGFVKRTHQSRDLEECTYQSSNPGGYTYQFSDPEGCTYQSSDPEGCTHQSSDSEGCPYQSSDPGGCTYQSSDPEGHTYSFDLWLGFKSLLRPTTTAKESGSPRCSGLRREHGMRREKSSAVAETKREGETSGR